MDELLIKNIKQLLIKDNTITINFKENDEDFCITLYLKKESKCGINIEYESDYPYPLHVGNVKECLDLLIKKMDGYRKKFWKKPIDPDNLTLKDIFKAT